MFSLSSMGAANAYGITEIWKDETLLVTAFAAEGTNSGTSNAVFIQCDSGSRVYVQCNNQFSCTMYGTQYGYTNIVTFSGMLVAEFEPL